MIDSACLGQHPDKTLVTARQIGHLQLHCVLLPLEATLLPHYADGVAIGEKGRVETACPYYTNVLPSPVFFGDVDWSTGKAVLLLRKGGSVAPTQNSAVLGGCHAVIEASTHTLDVLCNLDGVHDISHCVFLTVLEFCHAKEPALAPPVEQSLRVKGEEETTAGLDLGDAARDMMLSEWGKRYLRAAGWADLKQRGAELQLMILPKRSRIGNWVSSTWLYPHRYATPEEQTANDAPLTLACTSTMNGLAALVNLQIQAGSMFSLPALKWPRPSCPKWLQPMLKTAPKLLAMRQQPLPQLTLRICLLGSSRQGGSTRRLPPTSSSTAILFSGFQGFSSSGKYISPHPATSPWTSQMMAALARERSFAKYWRSWWTKGSSWSAAPVLSGNRPHWVSPSKQTLRFFSGGALVEGSGISLKRTMRSVLLVKPCWFHVKISQTDLPCWYGQTSTSTSLVPSFSSTVSSKDSLPCSERRKRPAMGLYLPLEGSSMRQRQHCFCRSIFTKMRSRMSFGGSGVGCASTYTYSTFSSQSAGSKGLRRGSSNFTTITSRYSSLSHSVKRLMISASPTQAWRRDSMSSWGALWRMSSLHLGLARKSVRMDRKRGLNSYSRSFIRCYAVSACFWVRQSRPALKVEKARLRSVRSSQSSRAVRESSSKGASKALGRRYFSMYFSIEVQRRQISSCLSLPRKSEAQSKSSCGKEVRTNYIADSITRPSNATSAGLLFLPCLWAFLDAFFGSSAEGRSFCGRATREGTSMQILSGSAVSSCSCVFQKACSSSRVAALREWSNLVGLKVLRKSSQFWMYLTLKAEKLPRCRSGG